jgi:hypothetical protein
MHRFLLGFWRWLRAEIVFGFMIASVFWAVVLGWQAAYAPTYAEKQKCYDVAHNAGHKNEECKSLWEKTTSDPVAFFTLVLAVSTIGLRWPRSFFIGLEKDSSGTSAVRRLSSLAICKHR